jgi:hypothetical protein
VSRELHLNIVSDSLMAEPLTRIARAYSRRPYVVEVQGEHSTVRNAGPFSWTQNNVRVADRRNADGELDRRPSAPRIDAATPDRPATLERERHRPRSLRGRAQNHNDRASDPPPGTVNAEHAILVRHCPAVCRDTACRPHEPVGPRDAHKP